MGRKNRVKPHMIKCEAFSCEVEIPSDLKDGHGILELCGSIIAANSWALCPKHADEWIKEGHGCISLEHYKDWQLKRLGFIPAGETPS